MSTVPVEVRTLPPLLPHILLVLAAVSLLLSGQFPISFFSRLASMHQANSNDWVCVLALFDIVRTRHKAELPRVQDEEEGRGVAKNPALVNRSTQAS